MDNSQYVAIAGFGRSGSTILELVLTEALGGVAIGELKYLWYRGLMRRELCACGVPVPECPFWSRVVEKAFPGVTDYSPIERLRRRVERHRLHLAHRVLCVPSKRYAADRAAYSRILHKVICAIREMHPGSPIIDGSKDPAHVDIVRETLSDAVRVVHLVRDSRAVAFSLSRPKRRPEVHWAHETMGEIPPPTAAFIWGLINWMSEGLRVKNQGVLLRYEDFATAPEMVLAQLTTWLNDGLSLEPGGKAQFHSVSGNPIRFERSRAVSLDRRWESEMSRRDKLVVSGLTCFQLRRYGYPFRNAP